MTETQIKETLLEGLGQIAPEVDLDTLDPNANVRETLDIDSLRLPQHAAAHGENAWPAPPGTYCAPISGP